MSTTIEDNREIDCTDVKCLQCLTQENRDSKSDGQTATYKKINLIKK